MSTNYTSDQIVEKMETIIKLCKENEELYKDKKNEMMEKIREWDPVFYNRHYRVCKTIVQEEGEGVKELLSMLERLKKIEQGQTTLEEEDKKISNTYNSRYINPILNSKELVKEREEKIRNE